MDQLLTLEEFAARVRRPVATAQYWRAMGTGPRSARISGRVMYSESDVERWIDEQFASGGSHLNESA